ncbi:MAG: NAD(P)-dependent oxidoreductase [Myxococcaceae bacterium]|nr:NAD(P)-dependent oxidoreductase [Myxococcaceae bacterium]
MIKRVGFLGMGLMGSRMAKSLVRRGFTVVGWNRTPREVEGVTMVKTPGELATQVDAFCTCVADPPALEPVASQLLAASKPGQLFIDFSTVSVALVQSLAARAKEKGVDFADAPVTGSKMGAEKGTLVIMTGCSDAVLERARPVFMGVGEKVIHCGPAGAGTQVKLGGNVVIAAMLEALSEGMLTISKAGVDPKKLLEVIEASAFRSPYYQAKGNAMLARDFSQHFSIDLMHKDLGLFLDEAARHRVPTPAAAALRETYNLARSASKGDLDICGVVTALEDLCGHRLGSKPS